MDRRGDECVPGSRFLKPVPSCFRMLSNTTVRAGMLTPMAKVSVANSTLTRPRENSISITSFRMGRMPLWCTATPRFSKSLISRICQGGGGDTPPLKLAHL